MLLWPAAPPDVDLPAETAAFRWNADELFAALEAEFTRAGATELGEATDVLDGLETEGSARRDPAQQDAAYTPELKSTTRENTARRRAETDMPQ